ncbi:hypothetical protein J45TS6_27520 [Paenibacillus sp. J45TS6]|uniref:hypothetical protein n=1 Tax=unclassified Paenibacillus TaxID=185978 RepID=UPI001AFF952D|nr:hypothetical protein [Paenibacillus sp. J45TS6]GIP44293.1 hypothetical protein J45TS6_27520 [Paenibacillus sp. J45TS6]
MKKYGLMLGMLLILILSACSQKEELPPYADSLTGSSEVLIRQEEASRTITDEQELSAMIAILNQGKSIEVPEEAQGINPATAKEAVLMHFPKVDLVYIGDGHVLSGLDGTYYEVPQDIEDYLKVK